MNLAALTAWRTAIELARDETVRRRGNGGARRSRFLSLLFTSRTVENGI